MFMLAGILVAATPAAGSPRSASRRGAAVCSFDEATGLMAISLPARGGADPVPVVIARQGDTITVDGVACGSAAVTNTDQIDVGGDVGSEGLPHDFEIDLSGGALAPGRTDEGDGSSEIEMVVDLGTPGINEMTIRGGDAPDTVLLHGTAVNLDALPDDVPDLRLLGMHADDDGEGSGAPMFVKTGSGADVVSIDAHGHSAPTRIFVRGADGRDRILASFGRLLWAYGGPGPDRLRNGATSWLSGGPGDDALITGHRARAFIASGGSGSDVLVGGPADDSLDGGRGRDDLTGRAGRDSIYGPVAHDRVWGGAGGDWLFGNEGDDRIVGGDGVDELRGGPGHDRCDDDPDDVVVLGCSTSSR